MTNAVPIILDCDPGHDDAIAIVTAVHHAELVGVTTVAGNAPLASTTHNACVMRELLTDGSVSPFPVHSGAARPLVAPQQSAGYVHGESGLDGAALPEPSRGPDSTDAVGYIIETCRKRAGIWLVGVGPLTNLALALRAAPDLATCVAGISVMGGGTFGNRTAMGEFNIWADPEAAAIVFQSGVPMVMAGLDVTHQFQATPVRIAAIREHRSRLATVLADLLTFFSEKYVAQQRGDDWRRRARSARRAGAHSPRFVRAGRPERRRRDRRHPHPWHDRHRSPSDAAHARRPTSTCSPP